MLQFNENKKPRKRDAKADKKHTIADSDSDSDDIVVET